MSLDLTQYPKVPAEILWHVGYWDGPTDGIALHNGERFWFSMAQDECERQSDPQATHVLKGALHDLHPYLPRPQVLWVSVDREDGAPFVEMVIDQGCRIGVGVQTKVPGGLWEPFSFLITSKRKYLPMLIDHNEWWKYEPIPERLVDLDSIYHELDAKVGDPKLNWYRRFTLHRMIPEQLQYEEARHQEWVEAKHSHQLDAYYAKYPPNECNEICAVYHNQPTIGWFEK